MRPRLLLATWLLGLAAAQAATAQGAAPADTTRRITAQDQAELDRALAPVVARAMAGYPAAKRRFEAGLPRGQAFLVTTRLRDDSGRWEQVFIRVESIRDGFVSGTIDSQISAVKGYAKGDPYRFAEAAVLDWLIRHPDGEEDGNLVGRFMDTYQRPSQRERDEVVLDEAQRNGAALAEAVRAGAVFDLDSLANAAELRERLARPTCAALAYTAYRVETSAGTARVYLLGRTDQPDAIVMGRHFMVPVRDNRADLDALQASTKGCLTMARPTATARLMVTAPGLELPNDFHVFVNEYYGVDLYVVTERGLWKVTAGLVILQR